MNIHDKNHSGPNGKQDLLRRSVLPILAAHRIQGAAHRRNPLASVDRWQLAFDTLDNVEKDGFRDVAQPGQHFNIEALVSSVLSCQDRCERRKWVLYTKSNGQQVYLRDTFARFVRHVQIFQQCASNIVQLEVTGHAALPWALVQLCIQITINDVAIYGDMLDGVTQVCETMARNAKLEQQKFIGISEFKKQLSTSIVKLYQAVLKYLLRAGKYYSRNTASRILRAAVETSESIVGACLAAIKEAENGVTRLAGYVTDEEQNRLLSAVPLAVANEIRRRNDQEAASVVPRRKSLSDWLRAINTDNTFNAVSQRKQEGTCDWIFSNQAYQDWSSASSKQSSILWLHGPPGFGKTFLSARLGEHFMQQDVPFAAFFCLAEDESRRDPFAVLRSWVSEIVAQSDKATHAAYEIFSTRKVQEPSATDSDLWRSFQAIGKAVPRLTLLVDGYDECTQISSHLKYDLDGGRSFFLSELLRNMKQTILRVVIVSRDRPDISSALDYQKCEEQEVLRFEHGITPADNGSDVSLCSKAMIKQRYPKKFDETTRDRLAAEAASRSEGMFLWLAMFGKSMKQWDSEEKLRKKIMDMPSELEHIYQDELDRVLKTDRENNAAEMARSILRWTLFAARPLTIREMVEVMVLPVEGNEPLLSRYDVVPDDWHDIDNEYLDIYFKQPCGILIQLQSRNSSTPLWEQTIHFPHFSIKEFLLKPRGGESRTRAERLYLQDDSSENRKLAAMCLQYLCLDFMPELGNQAEQRSFSLRKRLKLQPFLAYSSTYWSQHAATDNGIAPELLPHVRRLFNPDALHWKIWSEVFEAELAGRNDDSESDTDEDSDADSTEDYSDGPGNASHDDNESSTAAEDFESYSSQDDDDTHLDADVRNTQPEGPKPIYLAAYLGLDDIIADLLVRGDSCNSRGGRYGFPLRAAAYNGHFDTVKFLLDHGANVNQQDSYASTAAHAAASQGHATVVKLLNEHGADLCALDSDNLPPIHYACQNGSTEALQAFVDLNLLVEVISEVSPSPLTSAIINSQDKAVEFLLEHGASATKECHFWNAEISTPLGLATIYGTNRSMELLTAKGAEVETTCKIDKLMMLTARYDMSARFFWLHKQGIRVEQADEKGLTDLHWASWNGNVDIVKALILEVKDINIADTYGRSPLTVASLLGRLEVAQTLVKHGADLNFQGKAGDLSPIYAAACNPQHAMLEYLLQAGADAHKTYHGETSFDIALQGDLETVKLLLVHGAIRDPEDDQWMDTLHLQQVALVDNLDAVQQHVKDLRGKKRSRAMAAAISAAAAGGASNAVSWFCEQHVRDCFVGTNGRTALHMAIAGGHFDITQKLIAVQDLALPDYFDLLPIHAACTKHGAAAKELIVTLLTHGGIAPSGTVVVADMAHYDKLLGQWEGHYTYLEWHKGRQDKTSFTLQPYNATSISKDATGRPLKVAPWLFYNESVDQIGNFSMYGQMLTNTKFAFVKMYEKHGWLYHGEITKDGTTLEGTWGSSPQLWHGRFEMTRAGVDGPDK